tara:strand:- start:764 stop:1300 length:537 start_codon:yes stop_codon:yes gene_type:complete
MMKTKAETYVADAYTKMESVMKDLGMEPDDSTGYNDLMQSLHSDKFNIQVFTPNSLVTNEDNEEWNTFAIWHEGDKGGGYVGEENGQTLLETIDLLKAWLMSSKAAFYAWLKSEGMMAVGAVEEEEFGGNYRMVVSVPADTELKKIDTLTERAKSLGLNLLKCTTKDDDYWYMEFVTK